MRAGACDGAPSADLGAGARGRDARRGDDPPPGAPRGRMSEADELLRQGQHRRKPRARIAIEGARDEHVEERRHVGRQGARERGLLLGEERLDDIVARGTEGPRPVAHSKSIIPSA